VTSLLRAALVALLLVLTSAGLALPESKDKDKDKTKDAFKPRGLARYESPKAPKPSMWTQHGRAFWGHSGVIGIRRGMRDDDGDGIQNRIDLDDDNNGTFDEFE